MIRDDAVVLGIESSCDETGVGIVRGQTLLANVIVRCWSASQQRSHMPAHLAFRCMG